MKAVLFSRRKQLFLRVPTFQRRFYFRLVGANGEIVAQSEAYNSKQAALDTLHRYFIGFRLEDRT